VSNPFIRREQRDLNERYRLSRLNPRPSRSVSAFADLSDEELAIAQAWYDDAAAEHQDAAERNERNAAFAETAEAEAARAALRSSF
jgi:hypothetical protein